MSRWQVLCERMNPNLQPYDKAYIAQFIGECVPTTIRRNSYCRVNYTDYWLSSPEVIEKLSPNNYKVDGKQIDTLVDMGRFNTADVEQTEEDKRILGKQMKYIHAFDEMMVRNGVTPVGTLKSESVKQIASAPVKAVKIPKTEEIDYLNYFKGKDYTRIGQDAV